MTRRFSLIVHFHCAHVVMACRYMFSLLVQSTSRTAARSDCRSNIIHITSRQYSFYHDKTSGKILLRRPNLRRLQCEDPRTETHCNVWDWDRLQMFKVKGTAWLFLPDGDIEIPTLAQFVEAPQRVAFKFNPSNKPRRLQMAWDEGILRANHSQF